MPLFWASPSFFNTEAALTAVKTSFSTLPENISACDSALLMNIQVSGHACRYGDSSVYGRWYGSSVHQFEG